MKARKVLLCGAALALGVSLASCGGKKQANYVVPAEGLDTTQTMELSFYHTMGTELQNVLQTAIDKFHKDYSNFTIKPTQVGGYDDVRDQITKEIPNNLQPNIAYCYPDHVALYNKSNAVVQLDNLIDDGTYGLGDLKSDFVPGYYDEGRQFGDGLMYTLPFSKSTEVLYYNKTEFDKNGWTIPTTWQEMADLCAAILKTPGFEKCYPLGIDSEANLFITLCEQTGSAYTSATGDHYLFNNDENKSYVAKFKEWFEKGYFTTQTILTTYTSSLFTQTDRTQKFSLMSIGSTGGASHQYPSNDAFEVGVAAVPKWDDNSQFKVISQGPSLCLFQKDNPQEVLASWVFLKDYLFTSEFQAAFASASGYNPVLNSAAALLDAAVSDPKGTSSTGLIQLTAKMARSFNANYFTSPAFNGSSKAREQVGDLFVAAISGTKDIDKAFLDAILECED